MVAAVGFLRRALTSFLLVRLLAFAETADWPRVAFNLAHTDHHSDGIRNGHAYRIIAYIMALLRLYFNKSVAIFHPTLFLSNHCTASCA